MSGSTVSTGWWRTSRGTGIHGDTLFEASEQGAPPLPFWALIAFTLVMILAPQNYITALKPLHLALVMGALASGAYLMSRINGTAGQIRRSPAMRVAVLLFLWAVALIPFSVWPGGSFAEVFNVFIKALIIFWLLGRVVNSVPRLRTVAWTLSLSSIPLSLSAISAFLAIGFGNAELTHGLERIVGYDSGLAANPNDLALMINLTLPFTVGLMLSSRKIPIKMMLSTIALLGVIAVFATYSRGGFLTLVTIAATYLLILSGRARAGMILVILGLGLAAIPLAPSGYWSRLSTITNIQKDRTDSAQERWSLMVDSMYLIAEHPVSGSGPGMDIVALNNVHEGGWKRSWKRVHNVYLEYAVDLGLIGLSLFLLLYYRVLKGVRMARRIATGPPENKSLYRLSEGIWVALIAFGVSALSHPVAYDFYFYYIAGLGVAAGSIALGIQHQYAVGSVNEGEHETFDG